MGMSTQTGIFPFAAPYVWAGSYSPFNPHDPVMRLLIWNEEGIQPDGSYCDDDDLPDEMTPRTENGWTFDPDGFKKVDGMYVDVITHEDGREVWFINESPYQAGGDIQATFGAKDPVTLQGFLDDFGLSGEIKHPCAVQQTL